MRHVNRAKVYLVSKPSVDWAQIEAFLSDEGLPGVPQSIRAGKDDSPAIVEVAGRLCYMSFAKGRRDIVEFVTNLLSSKDGSVFEHVNYGFVATGISRSLTHELVRHRAGFAYSQRSQRYVDEKDSSYVIPPALDRDDPRLKKAKAIFAASTERASADYAALVEALDEALPATLFTNPRDQRKAVRQAARAVLPNATETKLFVTANVRAWRHFIEMRGASFADWEIRAFALQVLELLQKEAPLFFGDFTVETLPDGTRTATPKYSKV